MRKGNIKLFNTESQYLLEKDSFEYPTVCYVIENNKVYYMEGLAGSYLWDSGDYILFDNDGKILLNE